MRGHKRRAGAEQAPLAAEGRPYEFTVQHGAALIPCKMSLDSRNAQVLLPPPVANQGRNRSIPGSDRVGLSSCDVY